MEITAREAGPYMSLPSEGKHHFRRTSVRVVGRAPGPWASGARKTPALSSEIDAVCWAASRISCSENHCNRTVQKKRWVLVRTNTRNKCRSNPPSPG
ncbi:hypothetical protein CSHISOI_09741 [Colletotrichum shisoi]|uniref:Uncharacterized protein n=1 Tax=Colletotrichum shisoi TaxID=2078593 RepID=A0A5Q4BFY2_9PEZI|nr:hypothetical protein CSHISOI_09741 [Colletotrichum shisoi]